MTGGIIPQCATCNDLGKDPNGCGKCSKLGPSGRKKAADNAVRATNARKIQPKGAAAAAAKKDNKKK